MDNVEPALTFTTEDTPTEPIPFEIDGERFFARAWITGAAFYRYAGIMAKGGWLSTTVIEDFFTDALDPDEHARFRKFIEDPARRVTTDLLTNIFMALYFRYGGGPAERSRPTKPSRPSRSGREQTSDTSKENSSSEASTPEG